MSYVAAARVAMQTAMPSEEGTLVELYALLALTKGESTTLADVHDAWALWRSRSAPAHRALAPFEELTADVQELDRPYMETIHAVRRVLDRARRSSE